MLFLKQCLPSLHPPTGTCRVLIIKVITICIQTTVAQAVDWDADVGHTQF